MRLLLDTHAFLWFVSDDDKLSREAEALISEPENQIWVSTASLWEIAIKVKIGKLSLARPFATFIPEQLALNYFEELSVEQKHLARTLTLPLHHRDPFDRLLIAQALEEDLTLVSKDSTFAQYAVPLIW